MKLPKKKVKGVLPSPKWLRNNRCSGLNTCMQKNPELFLHIAQDRYMKTIDEWVEIAENLAKKNNGILPNINWLTKNGYQGLNGCMRLNPKFFKHIKQKRLTARRKTNKEWVKIAENLAKKNEGMLPNSGWLQKNGHSRLDRCLRKHPELFKHIKQESKRGKNPEEWVELAEQLAKENGGLLPYRAWLNKNGFIGLYQCIKFYPELFKHIEKEKLLNSQKENIKLAEHLAKKNNGILPNSYWLKENGYNNIAICMFKHPELFKHIEQEYKGGNTPEENVKLAKQLAEDNNGILPCGKWLINNGYNNIYNCIQKHPELFKHIKRDYKGGKTLEEWVKIAKKMEKKEKVLPCSTEIYNRKLFGLWHAIRKNPEAFKGMKQEYKNGVRIIEE